ncbi:MAG: amidohydrolase family protein [Haloarculaceae archaeon]
MRGGEAGETAPTDVPEFPVTDVVDAHVHLMPERLMRAIREALNDEAGWEFSHPTDLDRMTTILTEAGVDRFVCLPYAHSAGIADGVNEWINDLTASTAQAVAFGTVHAADEDIGSVVAEAFEAGARGLKFQFPVQGFPPDDPRLHPAYETAVEYDYPVMMHAGTAPMFRDDPNVGVERFRSFLESFPDVRACAAHMGAYEFEAFLEVARTHENAFLDTTFAMSSVAEEYMDFDPASVSDDAFEDLSTSIMYGSDFPNIPYAYAREREHLLSRDLSRETLRDLFSRTARRFLGEV